MAARVGRITRGSTWNRNRALDDFVEAWWQERAVAEPMLFVDLGVGYPPLTTVETARRFAGRAVVRGLDLNLPDYVVQFQKSDTHDYAVFFELEGGDTIHVATQEWLQNLKERFGWAH